jgi:secreted trypsin-like serine protease
VIADEEVGRVVRVSFSFRVLMVAALVAGAATIASVARAGPAGAVAHGEVVPEGRYRFAARLAITYAIGPMRFTTVCSGALVAPSWVVTAGHCFVDATGAPVSGPVPRPTTVTVGQNDLTSPKRRHPTVAAIAVDQAPGTDIALVKLARPVTDIAPLAVASSPPALGMTLRITGWGATSALPIPAGRLHTGQVTVASIAATTIGVRGLAPAPDTSACLYDSGAPYFSEGPGGPRLVAVESDGPTCPHDQEETAARADVVAAWIAGHTG